MGSTRTWRAMTFVLLVLLVATVARSTLAMPVLRQATTFKKLKVVTETAANTIATNKPYSVDLPGATTSIGIPEGVESMILVRFSAESACYGRLSGWCSVRIFVGSAEGAPKVGDSYAFDSVNLDTEGASDYEGHAVERVVGPLGGDGSYTVRVERSIHITDDPPHFGASAFRLDDWTLTVERIDI